MARSTMPGFSADGGGSSKRSTSPRSRAAAVEDQAAVAVVDAGAGLGRRDQPSQHRRDALRIDRKIQPGILVRRAIGFAGLQVEQPVGIDGDGVGFDGGGGGDRARDDLGLHQQALRARVDQAGAELREIENARHQRDEAGEIERDDAAGEAGEATARRRTARRGAASRAAAASPCAAGCRRQRDPDRGTARRPRRSGSDQAAFDLAMAKTAGCFESSRDARCSSHPTPDATAPASVNKTGATSDAWLIRLP